MKPVFFLVAVLAFLTGCGEKAPVAKMLPEKRDAFGPKEWELTPEVAAEVKTMRANDTYRPHRDRTRVFVRTQLKYGLERDDYLHKWYDRPLMGDVRYQEAGDAHPINVESWRRMAEMAKLCGHGFSAFTIASGRDDIIPRSVLPGYESEVMVEIVGDCTFEGGASAKIEPCLKRIEEALKMPNAFRVNGKLVITSYPAIRLDKMGFYAALKTEIAKRWGDRVALMPYFTPFEMERGSALDLKEVAQVKENLRTALRTVDGLCFPVASVLNFNRRSNPKFTVETVTPIIHSVLSEPEFKDKLFGMVVGCGHENTYRWNYAQDCAGTQRMRDNFDAVTALRPDFVNACEWDEENENTHHRPTVALGFVHSRLLRYMTAVLDGRAPEVWPNDDVTVPNLVVSYRKALLAGEPIEVEVLNLPDGTFKGDEFVVEFAWKNAAGETVKTFEPQLLKADELKAAWFTVPATGLLAHPILKPELVVWQGGLRRVFAEGLWPLSLHANRSVEFRWVKQSLRDKLSPFRSRLAVSGPAADGTFEVSGTCESAEELRSVEVLDGPDTVYLYDPAAPKRDADGSLAVRILWQGLPWNNADCPSGFIRLKNAPNAVFTKGRMKNAALSEGAIIFKEASIKHWTMDAYVDIPASDIAAAEFEIDLPPYFVGNVTAKGLIEKDVYSFPAVGGMNLVFRRWLAARKLTPPCGGKRAEFSFRMKPSTPDSILRVQAIDEKFRVYAGSAYSFFKPSYTPVKVKAFERDLETIGTAVVDANRVTPFEYVFGPERGGVVAAGPYLGLGGILCGYAPLVSGYGSAESGDGNVILDCAVDGKMKGWPKTVPEYVKEADGIWSLKFADCSFVTLPQQVVPEYVGFDMELEVNPDDVQRRQGLFTTGHAYFNLGIEKGRVFAYLFTRNGYFHSGMHAATTVWGPKIAPGVWSKVRVVWDRLTCRVDVNGEKGEPVKVSGDLFYARPSALGTLGSNDSFFAGRMRRVRVGIADIDEVGK